MVLAARGTVEMASFLVIDENALTVFFWDNLT
jgi:hypothetical protein